MQFVLLVAVLAAVASTGLAKNVICYYASWSYYSSLKIDNIDPTLCTHVIYSFLGLDDNGYIKPADPWNDVGDEWHEGGFKSFQKLKNLNPSVKLLASVGGWNEGPIRFQSMVRSPEKRKRFLESTLNFLRQYKFDGLEIAWMFQGGSGDKNDKEGFSDLVREMSPRYKDNNFILSAATSGNRYVIDNSYDIPVLSRYLDFINVISYDLHGSWDGKTGHVSPLYAWDGETGEERYNNVEAVIRKYIEMGANREKLNVGTVGYGRTFKLFDSTNNGLKSPTTGPGNIEPLPYRTFCLQDRNGVWKKYRNAQQAIPYAVSGIQWVGYEDTGSLIAKAKFVKSSRLGGVTFFSLDTDDYKGECSNGKFPLLRTLRDELQRP